MSRGLGRIQRAILALIDTDVDGARITADICQHVYGAVEKRHRVAVGRAMRTITLPGLWKVWDHDKERCLYNAGSVESTLRKDWLDDRRYGWKYDDKFRHHRILPDSPSRIEWAHQSVKKALDRATSAATEQSDSAVP
jgi:hypothetical protein